MRVTTFTIFFFMTGFTFGQVAQKPAATSQSKTSNWECGVHAGHFFTTGNVDFIPGYAGGFHIRRALDYVFSLRFDMMYGSAKGEDKGNERNFSNQWLSGSLQAVATLNNLKWSMEERRTQFYIFGGAGLNSFSTDFQKTGDADGTVERKTALQVEAGAGISFRINPRVNLGLDHKSGFVPGSRSDLLDGFQTQTLDKDNRGTFRDAFHYTSMRVNVNLGNGKEKSEPFYWLNPLDAVITDLNALKEVAAVIEDEDEDGVFDKYDKDNSTLPGSVVNSKGQTIDSDSDGYADYVDKEPFSPPGYPIDSYGVAKKPDPLTETKQLVESRLDAFEKEIPKPTTAYLTDATIINLMLPTLYFSINSAAIGGKDLLHLENVGKLMTLHPHIRIVVTGHSDRAGKELGNQNISYSRAKSVIDYLIGAYNIRRERFVLQYKGSSEYLMNSSHEANRRVRFRLADNEIDMRAPGN